MHPVQFYRGLLKRLLGHWIEPVERAVHVAHGIQAARRRAERRPLPRSQPSLSGRPMLRLIQGGMSLQPIQLMRKNA